MAKTPADPPVVKTPEWPDGIQFHPETRVPCTTCEKDPDFHPQTVEPVDRAGVDHA